MLGKRPVPEVKPGFVHCVFLEGHEVDLPFDAVAAVGRFDPFRRQRYTVTLGDDGETGVQVAAFNHNMYPCGILYS